MSHEYLTSTSQVKHPSRRAHVYVIPINTDNKGFDGNLLTHSRSLPIVCTQKQCCERYQFIIDLQARCQLIKVHY